MGIWNGKLVGHTFLPVVRICVKEVGANRSPAVFHRCSGWLKHIFLSAVLVCVIVMGANQILVVVHRCSR